jgi:hypothetical protein
MSRRIPASFFLAVFLLLSPSVSVLDAEPDHERNVWNYDGGLQMMTDGAISSSGPCFRVNGRATAPAFFQNLKRVDTDTGSYVRRGHDIVTEFPEQLHLTFVMYDFPCDLQIQAAGTRTYLTKAVVGSLRLSLYWKHGMIMRPANGISHWHNIARVLTPDHPDPAAQLPERYEWEFEFDLPSAGIPVTDSLVLVLRTPDGHIAARAAARL